MGYWLTAKKFASSQYTIQTFKTAFWRLYVGVAAQVNDGFDFEERTAAIKLELADLDRELERGAINGRLLRSAFNLDECGLETVGS